MAATTRRIVVGVDGSQRARDALAWALANTGPNDRIEVAHAWEMPMMAGYEAAITVDPVELEEAAEGFVRDLVEEYDDARTVALTVRGPAGHALVELAAQPPAADMVVVGHQGEGKIALIGSVANHVAHHTPVPVVIVRGERVGRAARVVVGVDDHDLHDGDNESVRALRWAYGLHGIEQIDVLHAWFAPAVAAGVYAGPGVDIEEHDTAATEVIQRVVRAAGAAPSGVTVREVAERGTPGFALIEASRNADLLVVGSRGRGGIVGLILGSTCSDVIANSHTPVAVVH